MSYNVTGFTIKKLDNFRLPIDTMTDMLEDDIGITAGEVLTFNSFPVEGMEVVGVNDVDGDFLRVTDISYYGEYSGTYWDHFEELLTQSTGILKARIVWGGGDTVEVVTIENGVVTRKKL